MAFNALKYVQELRDSGVPQEQAEVQAKGQQLIQDDLLANVATKEDLENGLEKIQIKIEASQGNQTLKLTGAMAGLLAIFRFFPEFFKAAS